MGDGRVAGVIGEVVSLGSVIVVVNLEGRQFSHFRPKASQMSTGGIGGSSIWRSALIHSSAVLNVLGNVVGPESGVKGIGSNGVSDVIGPESDGVSDDVGMGSDGGSSNAGNVGLSLYR